MARTPITHRAAVLGSPIEHSRSPLLHNAGYRALGLDEWDYGRFECDADALPGLVTRADDTYAGFSVTMPGKFAALRFATEATDRALAIGSANTLVRLPAAGGWRADNTDVDGIAGALAELRGEQPAPINRALVIGSGGTARPAIYHLAALGVGEITVLNRSDRSAELASLTVGTPTRLRSAGFDADLVALGRAADVIISTVPAAVLAAEDRAARLAHAPVLDVIYEPWPTALAVAAAANGYRTVGGHVMLAHQAYGQFEQFTGRPAPKAAMRAALMDSLQ